MVVKLNLGCGNDVREGWMNFDKFPVNDKVGYIDLNKFPLCFPDNYADYILLSHVLEHIVYQTEFMFEIGRVLKPDGKVEVRLPCFSSRVDHRSFIHFSDDYFVMIRKGCNQHTPTMFVQEGFVQHDGCLKRFVLNLFKWFKCLYFVENKYYLKVKK